MTITPIAISNFAALRFQDGTARGECCCFNFIIKY
nr:MAG TPA: hypothetical protein [Caudoviricetes sp.]